MVLYFEKWEHLVFGNGMSHEMLRGVLMSVLVKNLHVEANAYQFLTPIKFHLSAFIGNLWQSALFPMVIYNLVFVKTDRAIKIASTDKDLIYGFRIYDKGFNLYINCLSSQMSHKSQTLMPINLSNYGFKNIHGFFKRPFHSCE